MLGITLCKNKRSGYADYVEGSVGQIDFAPNVELYP